MRRRPTAHDEGFTLVEVVVAISLVVVVALSLGAFAVQGMRLATDQQRAHLAVTVATERMDQVHRLTTSNAQLAALVAGRTSTTVNAEWTAAAGVPGVATTHPAWASVPGGTASIPLVQTVTRNGTQFRSVVLIGTCYQAIGGGDCARIGGSAVDPGETSPAALGRSRLIRTIVTVTYPGSCDGGDICRYTASGLFDTKGDLTWRTD